MATVGDRELLELIAKKLSDLGSFHGGFEKMLIMIEHIGQDQKETKETMKKVSDAMYDPDSGLFMRVRGIEQKLDTNIQKIDTNIADLEKEIQKSAAKVELNELRNFKASIEKICGGETLDELTQLIKLRRNLSKIYWSVLLTLVMSVGKLLFDLSKHT